MVALCKARSFEPGIYRTDRKGRVSMTFSLVTILRRFHQFLSQMARIKLLRRGISVCFCAQTWARGALTWFLRLRAAVCVGSSPAGATPCAFPLPFALPCLHRGAGPDHALRPRVAGARSCWRRPNKPAARSVTGPGSDGDIRSDVGAWTITISLPDGRMCLLANGQDYSARDEVFPASGRAI